MGQGKCYLCGSNVQDRTAAKHVHICMCSRIAAKGAATKDKTFLLKVKDKYTGDYFLYLLVDECVTLKELDEYLRSIWLECCGHLSCFTIDGETYDCDPEEAWEPAEGMDVEVGALFYEGLVFTHEYDYGTTTTLELRVMHAYPSLGEEKGITLLARNDGQDSPRDGVCGYCGPSEDILFMEHRSAGKKIRKKSGSRNSARSRSSAAESALASDASKCNTHKGENGIYEQFKNAAIDEKLEILDEIFSSDNPEADSVKILAEALEQLKNHAYSAKHGRVPFTVNNSKLTDHSLYDILKNLGKDELTSISKNLSMKKISNYAKDKLATVINEYIHANIEDILLYMPSNDLKLLRYLFDDNEINSDEDSEIFSECDARKSGILFQIEENDGCLSYQVPSDIKVKIEELFHDNNFIKSREFIDKLEQAIRIVLFYWGVVEKHDLLKEVSKLFGMANNDNFQSTCIKLLKGLSGKPINLQKVGSLEFFTTLADDISAVVMSDAWKKSVYPELTEEMIKCSENSTFELMLDSPYFKAFYEEMKEYFKNSENQETDDGDGDDYDKYSKYVGYGEEGDDLFEAAKRTVVDVYVWISNALPGTQAKDFFDGIKTESDTEKHLVPALEKVELTTKMLAHTPNIWLKGNAASGEVHLLSNGCKPYTISKKPVSKQGSESVKAEEKWKAGRNDPCPCGSGKKYKKCCLKQ